MVMSYDKSHKRERGIIKLLKFNILDSIDKDSRLRGNDKLLFFKTPIVSFPNSIIFLKFSLFSVRKFYSPLRTKGGQRPIKTDKC